MWTNWCQGHPRRHPRGTLPSRVVLHGGAENTHSRGVRVSVDPRVVARPWTVFGRAAFPGRRDELVAVERIHAALSQHVVESCGGQFGGYVAARSAKEADRQSRYLDVPADKGPHEVVAW